MDKWILHQDNLFYTALLVNQFLANKQIPMLEHSLYSPDLAHCDLYMYLKFKISLKGSGFQLPEDIWSSVTTILKGCLESYFQQCF
jgi:hypothetical protein